MAPPVQQRGEPQPRRGVVSHPQLPSETSSSLGAGDSKAGDSRGCQGFPLFCTGPSPEAKMEREPRCPQQRPSLARPVSLHPQVPLGLAASAGRACLSPATTTRTSRWCTSSAAPAAGPNSRYIRRRCCRHSDGIKPRNVGLLHGCDSGASIRLLKVSAFVLETIKSF